MTLDQQASTPSGAPSDSELIRAVASGDEAALSELYDRHAALILGLALRILGRREDAEETLQETFAYCWQQAGRYQADRAAVVTWLLLVARSRAIDRLRSRKVAERGQDSLDAIDDGLHTSSEGFSTVLSEERRRRVREELDRLPEEQRNVLEMAFFAGLSQAEIAAATAIPLGTVKTRTLLAMKKLRSALRHEIRELL